MGTRGNKTESDDSFGSSSQGLEICKLENTLGFFYDMCVLARVEKEYPEMYRKCLKATRKDALSALHVPTSKQNKLRAVIMWICPVAIPIAMRVRKLKYHVNVSNR